MRTPHRAGNRAHAAGPGGIRRGRRTTTDTVAAVSASPPPTGAAIGNQGDPAGARPTASAAAAIPGPAPQPGAPGTAVPGLDLPPLLSAAEVGAIFNRGARTIRRWARAGHLSPVRIGGAVFFRADAVRRLVARDVMADVMTHTAGGRAP